MLAARLDEIKGRDAVTIQVEFRIAHAIAVTHLASQVEDNILVLHEDVQRMGVAHVGNVDGNTVADGGDIVKAAAMRN